jgi:phosphoribosylaminoimidazole-succinocarboxamide synthase
MRDDYGFISSIANIPSITSLPKIYSGKVRDLYEIDSNTMLMVATDRLSTFDVILNQSIPNKGVYLTQIALFWFKYLQGIIPNHLVDSKELYKFDLSKLLTLDERDLIKNRFMIVKRLKPIPIEVIIRGYLAGSGYKDYLATGMISGIKLPPNLQLASKLPEPIFTPSTKAAVGDHDENITIANCIDLIGATLTDQIIKSALKIYNLAASKALECGIIIADTKFEFGLDENGTLTLMDEVLTPDSSRFWGAATYKVGINPDSFDKQFVRDYLEQEIKWNKQPPIPDLPEYVIQQTVSKYQEILKRLKI